MDKMEPPVFSKTSKRNFSSTSNSRIVKTTSAPLSEGSRAGIISEVMDSVGSFTLVTKNERKLLQCCCICIALWCLPKANLNPWSLFLCLSIAELMGAVTVHGSSPFSIWYCFYHVSRGCANVHLRSLCHQEDSCPWLPGRARAAAVLAAPSREVCLLVVLSVIGLW